MKKTKSNADEPFVKEWLTSKGLKPIKFVSPTEAKLIKTAEQVFGKDTINTLTKQQ